MQSRCCRWLNHYLGRWVQYLSRKQELWRKCTTSATCFAMLLILTVSVTCWGLDLSIYHLGPFHKPSSREVSEFHIVPWTIGLMPSSSIQACFPCDWCCFDALCWWKCHGAWLRVLMAGGRPWWLVCVCRLTVSSCVLGITAVCVHVCLQKLGQ